MAEYFYTGNSCFYETTYVLSSSTLYSVGDIVTIDAASSALRFPYIWDFELCMEIQFVDTIPQAESYPILPTIYSNCDECLSGNSNGYIEIRRCSTDELFPITYSSLIQTGGVIGVSGEYYYMTIEYPVKNGKSITDCFQIQESTRVQGESFGLVTSTAQQGTDCTDCPTGGSVYYYIGYPCLYPGELAPTIYFSSNTNYDEVGIITYTDSLGVDQFCGVIKEQSTTPPEGEEIFPIAILGNRLSCDECLSQVAKKRIIYECLNPESYQVVWASVLFEVGDTTSVFFKSNTCFTIGPETEEEVTITDFAEFTPTPTCEDCLQCSGFYMELTPTDCGETGSAFWIQSFSYVPLNNFINVNDQCYEVTNYSQSTPESVAPGIIYSTPEFTTCEECTSTDVDFWYATGCTDGNDYYVFTNTGFNSGDIVQILYGETPYKCVELITTEFVPVLDAPFYYSPATTPYTSCESCQQNKISATIIDCEETNQFYVTMTLEVYETILNTSPVFLIYDKCYRMLNECPLIQTYDNIIPSYYFNNCIDCNSPLKNGFEITFCDEICTPSGTTVTTVTPPHPVYSTQYGKDILQLNMVTIGGNGLNA